MSFAVVTTQNMELTPVRVSFKPPGATAFVDLGGTLSNVVIDIKTDKADIKADQFGVEFMDKVNSGFMSTVTTELTEVQNKDIWTTVFPNSTPGGTSPNDYILFTNNIGQHDIDLAGQLLLHPLSKTDGDLNSDYFFYLATASAESQVSYGPDKQVTLKIVWNIFPDTTFTPARYFVYGDESLVP